MSYSASTSGARDGETSSAQSVKIPGVTRLPPLPSRPTLALVVAAACFVSAVVSAQRRDVFVLSRDHPAIRYTTGDLDNVVTRLNQRLASGAATLAYDAASGNGYLRSLLEALAVPVSSQTLVFSKTSFQADLITMHNPRALYFADAVAVGWVRGAEALEIAATDRRQGAVFYTLAQKAPAAGDAGVRLERKTDCLACHLSWDTLGVPGFMTTSMYPLPDDPNAYANGFTTMHGSPLEQRWGGWWVTGDTGGAQHMGNIPVMPEDKGVTRPRNPKAPLASVEMYVDQKGYPVPTSDVVALLVLNHQNHMTNLIARTGWEARVAEAEPSANAATRVREAASDLVDAMLFIDEAPFAGPVKGSSGFAEWFAAQGPKDAKGRSLREFDLRTRIFRYPCSYLIYGEAFDALPAAARQAVYARLLDVLSGRDTRKVSQHLTVADRQAILQILRETKRDLPDSFR
jgi:hypothetical protein